MKNIDNAKSTIKEIMELIKWRKRNIEEMISNSENELAQMKKYNSVDEIEGQIKITESHLKEMRLKQKFGVNISNHKAELIHEWYLTNRPDCSFDQLIKCHTIFKYENNTVSLLSDEEYKDTGGLFSLMLTILILATVLLTFVITNSVYYLIMSDFGANKEIPLYFDSNQTISLVLLLTGLNSTWIFTLASKKSSREFFLKKLNERYSN